MHRKEFVAYTYAGYYRKCSMRMPQPKPMLGGLGRGLSELSCSLCSLQRPNLW